MNLVLEIMVGSQALSDNILNSLLRRHSLGSLRDEPKECLRRRLHSEVL